MTRAARPVETPGTQGHDNYLPGNGGITGTG
jgi:hypothetical protein